MRRAGQVLLVLGIALLAGPGRAEEPPEADAKRFGELLEALGPILGATDPERRVTAVRDLLHDVRAQTAFPRLLALAGKHEGEGVGRAALEALSRLRAPRMAAKLDGTGMSSGTPDETGLDVLRGFAQHPLRVLPSVKGRLQAVVPGSGHVSFDDVFVGLATWTEKLDVAFVFDPEAGEVLVTTPAEAIDHHRAWLRGPGAEALAWADFLRAQQGVVHDGIDEGMIQAWIAQLLGDDASARRRAAYVLGRCLTAESSLRRALPAVGPAHRGAIEQVLARHELRAYGDVVFISARAGSADLWRMRLDGANLEPLTRGADHFIPEPSPSGRHVSYQWDEGERGWRLAVLDIAKKEAGAGVDEQVSGVRWSPDGRYLAYRTQVGRLHKLWLFDTRSMTSEIFGALPASRMGDLSLPAWSADGLHMVCGVEGQLRGYDLQTGEGRLIAEGPHRQPQLLGDDVLAIRHADGQDVLVRIAANGEESTFPRIEEEVIRQVTVSPDGRRAVLETMWAEQGTRKEPAVYLLDLAGEQKPRKVGKGMFARPHWSPSGDKVVLDRSFQSAVVLDADGNELSRPERSIMAGGAVWAPDGRVLYATEMLPNEPGVTPDRYRVRFRLVRWQDGIWHRLREVENWLALQRVTPDGRWLILATDDRGDRELIAASTDGRFWLNLTEHPAEDHSARPLPPAR